MANEPQSSTGAITQDIAPAALLEQACIDAASCALAFKIDGHPSHLKTHFDRCDGEALSLALTLDDFAAHEEHLTPETELILTFASGANDYACTTNVLSMGPTPDGAIHLRVGMPTTLTKVQRRKSFRIEVAPTDGWTIKAWRIDKYVLIRDKPPASAELKCELLDIGPGGLRMMVLAVRQEALQLSEDQRLRIEITADKSSVLMEGKLRYPKQTGRDDTSAMCGIAFVTRTNDIDARKNAQKLAAMLSYLERALARRRAAA